MGRAGKHINIRQGDGSVEEYARHFWEAARRLATEKTCLLIFFWGGLAEPFKSRMPYWNPEMLLEDYLILALHLSGSAFMVESAAEPARDSSEAAASPHEAPDAAASAYETPDTAVPAHTAPEVAVSTHRTPEAAVSAHRSPKEAEPAPFREPTESAPEPALFREPRVSAPEPTPFH